METNEPSWHKSYNMGLRKAKASKYEEKGEGHRRMNV